jgi:phenylacetate-CoA ligase
MELQDRRLGALLKYAYDNVPYYHEIFEKRGLKPDDIKGSRDLTKLPVLTKQIIRDNFGSLTACGLPKGSMNIYYTGGSTGEPLKFYRGKDDISGWDCAAGLRAFQWTGYELGRRCVILGEHALYETTAERFVRRTKRFLERVNLLEAKYMSEQTMPFFIKQLEHIHDGVIRGYPSSMYLIARFIEREGGPRIRPRAIIPSGEKLYDFQKELIKRVFDCDTYSYYRSTEINAIACECSSHSGHHISAENIIVEIVDEEYRPVPAGQEGAILVTNLHSGVMPFIRYDIGDVGAIYNGVCSCGRGLPVLAALNGRITDILYTRSGKSIPGVALPMGFLATWDVYQFQVVQNTYDDVTVKMVLDGGYSQEYRDRLCNEVESQYRAILRDEINIKAMLVDKIDTTTIGKRRIVISNVAQES